MSQPLDILKDILAPKPIVSFREFVTSSEFCNCKDMYEFWFNSADKLPDTISELLIDGSLGGGKSWFSNYYLAYRVYKLFAKGSPQKQLGLAEDSEIFGFFSFLGCKLRTLESSLISCLSNIRFSFHQ